MASLFNRLVGNGSQDRELAEEMRTVIEEMRQERERFQMVFESSRAAADRLQQLGEPIAKAGSDVNAVTARLEAIAQLATRVETLDERSQGLAQSQQQADAHLATVVQDSQQIRTVFETLSEKVDLAASLQSRMEAFLEVDKPFGVLHGQADEIRGQVEGTNEHLGRLRAQNERLVDAHKLAMSKMEALDRRREELSRDLTDKERRVVAVEMAIRGMDGVRGTVDDVKRELGTVKALADTLSQKIASLEVQREAVERALAQADSLERAMRQIDAGVQQQAENQRRLGGMQDELAALRSLHEEVTERSGEINRLQLQIEEQTGALRHDLTAARDGMKNAVERFDFESKGLESVSQRVGDLRGALSDFENRFQGLRDSSRTVSELNTQTDSLTAQLKGLLDESARIDAEVKRFHSVRDGLDIAFRTTAELGARVARIEEARPAVDAVFRDFERLGSSHAMVKDTLEQTKIAHGEIARMLDSQSKTRTWLLDTEQSLRGMKDQVGELQDLAPTLDQAQKQTQRINESLASIESRRDSVEELQGRLTDLGALGSDLDERSRQLQLRMEAAEERFHHLAEHAEEADRISKTVAGVTAGVHEAARQTAAIGKTVTAFEARCQSVEAIAEQTEVLRQELEQRQHALEEAGKNLKRTSKLRQEAADSAQQLEELVRRLGEALATADSRAQSVDGLSASLEERVRDLQAVDNRLGQFEKRLAQWEHVDEVVSRALEQISARQGTVQTLQADLDRMVTMAEQTSEEVRTITAARREVAESRGLLDEVLGRVREIQGAASALDERKRQMAAAEERLARADALLIDVRSGLEALQGQKVIVEQAVEKAGSLKFLLKQAEATIDGLREERNMTADVRSAVAVVRQDDESEGSEGGRKARNKAA